MDTVIIGQFIINSINFGSYGNMIVFLYNLSIRLKRKCINFLNKLVQSNASRNSIQFYKKK